MQPGQRRSRLSVRKRLVDGVVGANQEVGAYFCELICGGEHQLTYTPPVAAIDAFHVLGERVRVHRNLRMIVPAQKLCAFHADRPITKSSTFGGAGNNTDVVGHDLNQGSIRSPLHEGRARNQTFPKQKGHRETASSSCISLQMCSHVFIIFRPALRFLTRPFPPGDFAARLLAAVILPPLLFLAILGAPPVMMATYG